MKILYEVATMAQLAAACQSANDELQKAQSLVMEVQSHSDWTCKEKNTIDDLMRECKKRIQELCENEEGFLNAIRLVAQDLTEAEKNISGLFGGVESLLGKILAIPVKTVTVNGQSMLERIGFGMQGGQSSGTAAEQSLPFPDWENVVSGVFEEIHVVSCMETPI